MMDTVSHYDIWDEQEAEAERDRDEDLWDEWWDTAEDDRETFDDVPMFTEDKG